MEALTVSKESCEGNSAWAGHTFDPLIKHMEQQPCPLASKPLGQALNIAALDTSRRLLEPLNGCDYHLYLRRAEQDTETLVEALFQLLANPDANETIQFIIRTNIQVLGELQGVCEDQCEDVKRRALDVIHMDAEYNGRKNKAHIRKFVQEICSAAEEQKSWVDILGLEINVSEIALKRLGIANEAAELLRKEKAQTISEKESEALESLFIDFQSWRSVLIRWVLRLNKMTGNADFLRRHQNELWDIVDGDLEG